MSILLDLIFPRVCCYCHAPGDYLCLNCINSLSVGSITSHSSLPIEGRLSLYGYSDVLKTVFRDLKFSFVSDICPSLSSLAAVNLQSNFPNLVSYWQSHSYVFTSIPLHWYRRNWRGFNQSDLIVSAIARCLGLPCDLSIFSRRSYHQPQTSLKDKSKRSGNVSTSFRLTTSAPPSHLIIFDDVITTGATIDACTRLLPELKNVWQLSLAG